MPSVDEGAPAKIVLQLFGLQATATLVTFEVPTVPLPPVTVHV